MSEKKLDDGIDPIARTVLAYYEDAKTGKQKRMDMNRDNFDCYNLQQDWSHKKRGQSKEFLAKQQGATDQLTTFLQQGVVDNKDWFELDYEEGVEEPVIKKEELQKLVERQIKFNDPISFVSDSIKTGVLGSLMVCKVHGETIKKSRYEVEKIKTDLGGVNVKLKRRDKQKWRLKLELIRQEDYYPDPSGKGLYEIHASEMDFHDLLKLAEMTNEREGKQVYDIEVIRTLQESGDTEQEANKARETNQTQTPKGFRKTIRILECWGTIIDPGTKEFMNMGVCAVTEDGRVVRPLASNPFWHDQSPFVVAPIVRIPNSVWHRAVADAPTRYNMAQNEIFNLMLDGGLASVHGIKQIRENYLEDPDQVADGIPAGETLRVTAALPPGQKVLERIDSGSNEPETFNIYQMLDREGQASGLTNDTRSGGLSARKTQATEVVAANQALTGITNGMVTLIEANYFNKVIHKATLTCFQFMDDMYEPEIAALITSERAALLGALTPEERFAEVANGCRVRVYGFTMVMNKINDFRKISSLLQVIGTSPQMLQEYQREYSMTKLLGQIIHSLDIDTHKIKLSPEEKAQLAQEKAQAMAMQMAQINKGQGTGAPPNMGSQMANAANQAAESGAPQGEIQQAVGGG